MQNKCLKLEEKANENRKGVPDAKFVACKWKNKCTDNFPLEARLAVYGKFWAVPSIDQRRQFVIDQVTSASKKQSTTRENSRRSQTWLYDMENGQRIQICKTVFYNTLQIKEKFVRYALQASELGVAEKDQRGKHAPIHKP